MGKAWDKIILILVGVIVIAVSALFSMKALGFGELFVLRPATPDNTLPVTDQPIAERASKLVDFEINWTNPAKGVSGTQVPLFVSIPIVESDGVLINMLDPEAPQLREPATNAWLLQNNLDFLKEGVLLQDPDGDGFTSLAEWEAKTDPKGPDSHPPYAEKLVMRSRQQQEYRVIFNAKPDAERFQIKRVPTGKWPKGDNFLMRVGEVSEDQQFRIDAFEEKSAQRNGITVDASVLKITHLPTNVEYQLIRGVELLVPTYFAELEFLLDAGNRFYVKEGEAFNLLLDPETKYRVTKVNEDSTQITFQTGTEAEQTAEIKLK